MGLLSKLKGKKKKKQGEKKHEVRSQSRITSSFVGMHTSEAPKFSRSFAPTCHFAFCEPDTKLINLTACFHAPFPMLAGKASKGLLFQPCCNMCQACCVSSLQAVCALHIA